MSTDRKDAWETDPSAFTSFGRNGQTQHTIAAMADMSDLAGIGLYTIAEAARFTKAEPREIRRWLHGYEFKVRGEAHTSPPLWSPQVSDPSGIGFRDLLELRLVKEFVSRGVHLSVVRASIRTARDWFGDDHPLTTRRFVTDGKRVFMEALESGIEPLTDVVAQQRVIDAVIRPALFAGIDFLPDGRARRWFPEKTKTVVLDPELAFGAPALAEFGIRTDTIAAALLAEKSATRVAHLFNIPRRAVEAAASFERRYGA
jgi:uncharacterized protein (DUF433 family)